MCLKISKFYVIMPKNLAILCLSANYESSLRPSGEHNKPDDVDKVGVHFRVWQAAEVPILLESIGVPPAALRRSSEGLTAHWHPWKRLGMAGGMAFGPELAYVETAR